MTPLETITQRITWLLRLHERGGVSNRSMWVLIPPLMTSLQFEGVPLNRIMSPPVPADQFEAEQIFDSFISPIMTGEGDCLKELTEAGGKDLCDFVVKGVSRQELNSLQGMVTRLLFALGNADGAELRYGADHICVGHGDRIFGVTKGVVFSRFCEGFDMGSFDPRSVLESETRLRTFDAKFCSLYREAMRRESNRRHPGLTAALSTLLCGHPNFNFRKMAEYSASSKLPTKAQLGQWERVLACKKDPINILYKKLVPVWMTSWQFSTVFGRPGGRSLDPPPDVRQDCVTKLHTYFYKNKTKE